MKSFLMAAVVLMGLLTAARAQQEADERYIVIYSAVQQAENLADSGDPKPALAALTDAREQLRRFQQSYPNWNPGIISYRLDDLNKKITALQRQTGAPATPPVAAAEPGLSAVQAAKLTAEAQNLQAQLTSAQAENTKLQAKLKEALATQPASVNAGELAKAQDQVQALMKENDLLKASVSAENNTNTVSSLRRQLANSLDKYSQEQAQAEKLVAENAALQRDLQRSGQTAGTVELLRSENERLKAQLSSLQAAAGDAAAAVELAAKLKAANTQIASLQSTVTVVTLEKGALENRVKELDAEVERLRAANFEGRVRDLTQQRDELAKELAAAGKKPRKGADQQLAALTNEMQALRARLEVDESKAVPYSAEELALFRQPPPQPVANPTQRSVHELPGGSADLVASAQHHFANHEFTEAEADYQKILEHDQNNGLVLANLATIEMQENKLADAEKHITAALAQSPDDPYNLSTLGYLKYCEEKYDDALDVLSRAAKIDPNNPVIENYLGVTLSHKGLRVQAETALRKAIQINPLYAPAHNNLAVVYLNQTPSMPLLARWHYQKALAAGQPRNPDLEKLLAEKGAPVEEPSPAP